MVNQYAKAVLSFCLILSLLLGATVGVVMIDRAFVPPEMSFKVISYFLLGKWPSCVVAFFLLLRLTFVASFKAHAHENLEAQMLHPIRHIAASVWVGVLGWQLAMLAGLLGLVFGLVVADPSEVHAVWAMLSLEYDLSIALRGFVRTVLQATVLSWLVYLESVLMAYWQTDKETRMTQFIFVGLMTIMAIEIFDTVLFLN